MFDFRGWIRQPSTILGFGSFAGLVAAALANYAGGSVGLIATIGIAVFGTVHLMLPDNTQAAADAQALAIDVVKGAATHTLTELFPQMLRDGLALLTDIRPKPPSPAPVEINKGTAEATGSLQAAGSITAVRSIAAALMLIVVAVGLSACTAADQAAALNVEQAACKVDQSVVPIAAPVLAGLVPATTAALTVDQTLVHPAVVAYCSGLGGTPVKVTQSLTTTAPAAPVAAPAATDATTPAATTTPASTGN